MQDELNYTSVILEAFDEYDANPWLAVKMSLVERKKEANGGGRHL